MKYKSRKSGVLREYRRLMEEIRAVYDIFTQKYCPSCETPCCVRPTRVTPLDVALAEECGCKFEGIGSLNPMQIAINYASQRLTAEAVGDRGDVALPCEFLVGNRCSFNDDLRPYGCTSYICPTMYEKMDEKELRRLKGLVRQLASAHSAIEQALKPA
jgi:hypothetical protein